MYKSRIIHGPQLSRQSFHLEGASDENAKQDRPHVCMVDSSLHAWYTVESSADDMNKIASIRSSPFVHCAGFRSAECRKSWTILLYFALWKCKCCQPLSKMSTQAEIWGQVQQHLGKNSSGVTLLRKHRGWIQMNTLHLQQQLNIKRNLRGLWEDKKWQPWRILTMRVDNDPWTRKGWVSARLSPRQVDGVCSYSVTSRLMKRATAFYVQWSRGRNIHAISKWHSWMETATGYCMDPQISFHGLFATSDPIWIPLRIPYCIWHQGCLK